MAVKLLGDLSASGDATFNSEVNLASGGQVDWANGDARIREGLVTNYSLSFQTYTGAALTTKMFIQSGGNVGIGTTSPSYKLDVAGDIRSTGGNLRLEGAFPRIYLTDTNNNSDYSIFNGNGTLRIYDDTNSADRFAINSTGNVGIGTTAPLEKLHVVGKINSSNNIVSNSTYTMFTGRSSRTVDDYGGLNKEYFKANLVTPGPNTTGESSAHGIADLRFQLANSAGNTGMSDIMTLRSGGNVGIGTTSPGARLDVVGSIGVTSGDTFGYDSYNGSIYMASSGRGLLGKFGGSGYARNLIKSDGSATVHIGDNTSLISRILLDAGSSGANGYISLQTKQTERVRIDSSGNVGIGTTSPNTKLDVNGVITATSGNSTNWNTAYGWGDHGSAGYLTSETFGSSDVVLSLSGNDVTAGESITLAGGLSYSGTTLTSANAPLASPALTGTPTAPTAGSSTNTTQIATTAFVQTAVSNLVDSAPGALNTLNELAAALGDDASFSTTITNSIATKLPLAGGTLTGALTINQNGSALNLRSTTNAEPSRITFSSDVPAAQIGYIEYVHSDNVSYGSGEAFIIGGNQTTTILADGKLMYKDGIYSKPSSGTGAGTRKDANWDTAYGWGNHASAGYVTSSGVTSVTVGTGLDVSTGATPNITLDLSEFTDMTATMVGSDEFIVLDSGAERRKAANEINLSIFNDNLNYLEDITPATPSVDSTAVVGETIEITFSQSSTPDVDYYQVWSAVGSSTGSYGLIAHIPQEDVASTMTVIDATFSVSDTMYYRVYAVKSGVYSTAGTANRAFSAAALDVANMSVVNLNTAYYIQYEMPDSRFVDHVEIYMDAEAASGDLTRTGATLVYSGNNSSYMYKIGSNDLDKFHQFWVEVIES